MRLSVTCDADGRLERVPIDDLRRFQGRLKSLSDINYNRCKTSLLQNGFSFPVFYWLNPDGQKEIIDGHQRLYVIEKEGWAVDGDIPVVDIEAKDRKDAASKLLAMNSTYGHFDLQGLYEFVHEFQIDPFEELPLYDLPGVDVEKYLAEFHKNAPGEGGEGTGGEGDDSGDKVMVECPECGHAFPVTAEDFKD